MCRPPRDRRRTFQPRFFQTILSLANSSSRRPESILIPSASLSGLTVWRWGRDAKKHETVPSGFKLHPYLRGNRPFIRPRVAIDLRMRKWKDYSVMERAITGAEGEARGLSQCRSIYQFAAIGPVIYLSWGALADRAAWPLEPASPQRYSC